MRRLIPRASIAGAILAGAIVATPGVSSAATSSDASEHSTSAETSAFSSDEATDLKALAKSLGISYEEAVAGYGGQSAFFDIVTLATEVAPDTYAASEWLSAGKIHAWLSFTEAPPAEIIRAVAQLPYSVTVRTDAVQSAVEADAALSKAHEYLMSRGLGSFDLGFNVELDALVLWVSDQLSASGVDGVKAALVPYLSPGVRLTIEAGAGAVDFQDICGGQGFTWPNDICTTGFTAKRGTTWGVLAAGHCNTSSADLDGSTPPIVNVTGATGSGGDARYYSSVDSIRRNQIKIANSGTLYRTITGKTTVSVGGAVCLFGIQHAASWCTVAVLGNGITPQWVSTPD